MEEEKGNSNGNERARRVLGKTTYDLVYSEGVYYLRKSREPAIRRKLTEDIANALSALKGMA